MTGLALDPFDRALLDGRSGEACRLAMRIIVEIARVSGAPRLIDVSRAHIDGCLYHGRAGLDFAERLASGGGRVAVPTTLNVGSLDLVHPNRFRGDPATAAAARKLMDLYVAMGCEPTWTCAPYQLPSRPALGEQIAWAESNATVFANSVLGARTNRYGDFFDICAAITGRVPDAGLHRTANRRGRILFSVAQLPPALKAEDVLYPLLGHVVGARSGDSIPVIEGLPGDTSEDALKALGAAAASSGSVALFHAVGITPEAATLDDALQGAAAERVVDVTPGMLLDARAGLSTAGGGELSSVSLGTPHFSMSEFAELMALLEGNRIDAGIELYVSTSRAILAALEQRGWREALTRSGVRFVVDTCTYITPILRNHGVAMTNSGKWAYYAPGNIGVKVIFGSMKECVRSAVEGKVWRDDTLWSNV
ncbi:aconitase X catalytic domain-containing protein [soil metagenome]